LAELLRDRGLVLRTQDFAETDLLVSLLSEKRGRLEILAKGARRMEKTSGAILDLLNLVEVVYYRRRSGLHLLREASLIRSFFQIRKDFERLEAGLSLARWALELVPREIPDSRPFRLTLSFLFALEGGGNPAVLLRAFRLRFLSLLGYRPILSGCLSCGKKEDLTWSAERGGLLCRACGGEGETVPPRIWHTMNALLRLPLSGLLRLKIPPEDLVTIDSLVEAFRTFQVAR
jgi:DNA repair protein RecO (recombination protein O)